MLYHLEIVIMKKINSIIFAVPLLLTFSANAESETALPSCGENCTYTIENNVLTVKPIDLSQPASVREYNRDCTGGCHTDAPWYGQGITTINIEAGITDIAPHAFEDMATVTSLLLPEGLKTIGYEAFNATGNITSLKLPSTLTSIGMHSFGFLPLEEINDIPAGMTSIPDYAFHGSKITDWVIPATVTTISKDAFGSNAYSWGDDALVINLYCEEAIASQCEAALQWRKDNGVETKVIPYQTTSNGQVFYNNKWYDSANDILSNNYAKKRIYTIDEANKVSGRKNTFKIRYK